MGCGLKNKLPGLSTVLLGCLAMYRGGASAARGHGLGAFLRCDLTVDPVKLPSCLEGAGCIGDPGQSEMAQG